jgi:ACT domain-containing protein
MKAIITVVGKDQVGIMYRVSGILNEKHVNIEDVTQTILQDYFTMIMVVQIDETAASFHEVDEALHEMAAQQGLSIHVQKEEIFDTMHQI